MKLQLTRQIFRKTSQISNFMKIRPVGADITKLIVIFRNFVNSPKNTTVVGILCDNNVPGLQARLWGIGVDLTARAIKAWG